MSTVRNHRPALTAGVAEPLRQALRRMIAAAKTPAATAYERNVVERIQSGRIALPEHLATLLATAARRGTPLEEMEAVGFALIALARQLCAARDGAPTDRLALIARFRELSHEEALADGRADAEVLDALADPCPKEVAEAAREVARNARLRAEQREILDRLAVADLAPLTLNRA